MLSLVRGAHFVSRIGGEQVHRLAAPLQEITLLVACQGCGHQRGELGRTGLERVSALWKGCGYGTGKAAARSGTGKDALYGRSWRCSAVRLGQLRTLCCLLQWPFGPLHTLCNRDRRAIQKITADQLFPATQRHLLAPPPQIPNPQQTKVQQMRAQSSAKQ